MAGKLANPTPAALFGLAALASFSLAPSATEAAPTPSVVQNPYHNPNPAPIVIDLSADAERTRPLIDPAYPESVRFDQLDQHIRATLDVDDPAPAGLVRAGLPEGFSQVGGMIVPTEMTQGASMVPDVELALTDRPRQQHNDHIEEICAFPEDVPPGIYDYDHRPGGETPRFHTVYMNFVGGVLSTGAENSAENMSNIARTGHMFPVYAGGESKAIAAAQAVQNDLAPWAVRVAYLERPPKVLPYTMVMNGGHYSDTTAGPSGGVAPLDCEDFGQRNVCYAFGSSASATGLANVASQEIGHTLGLGHTQAPDSVMAGGYAPTNGGDLGFSNECAQIIQVSGQGAACVGVNKCHCGGPDGDRQHDHNTLFATFSPAGVDMVEPTIEIVSPEDGAVFEEGDDFSVVFEPWDDVGGYGWKFTLEDSTGEVLVDQVDYDRALEFVLTQLPPETYTITALIQDHADHVATDSITVVVEEAAGGEGESGGGEGGEGGSEGDDSGGSEGGEEGGDGSGGGATEADDGCGCTTTPASPASLSLLALFGLLGLRRRD